MFKFLREFAESRRAFVTMQSTAAVLLGVALSSCSGGGSAAAAPTPVPQPTAEFLPSSITVKASAYDYFGVFAFTAAANGIPKPINPADGSLSCKGGYSVPLQIRAGADQLGLVRDQYVVQPLLGSASPGTTLTCASTWGIYDATGALLASNTLNATVVYDAGGPAIVFQPASATLSAQGSNGTILLSYTSATGFSISPISPSDGTLSCPNGYAPQTSLKAGPGKSGFVEDVFVIDTASISPPAGTTLSCSTQWGVFDTTKTLVAQATLDVMLSY